ncbi:MAG: DMT family transporter [Gemmatimonadota bacterium]|nr:DMT family transporter [Gemmatimonadota bacterium]
MLKSGGLARATLYILISSLCFGAISVLTLLASKEGVSLIDAMAWRYLLAIIVVAIAGSAKEIRATPRSRAINLIVLGGGGQALLTFTSLSALDYISVATLAFLFYTYPAWVALISAVTGAERLTKWRVGALVLALAGVSIMVGAPGAATLKGRGVALALGASFLYAAYLPLLRKIQRDVAPKTATFFLVIGAAIFFVVAALIKGGLTFPASNNARLEIALLAVVSTGIAFTALIAGLSLLGPVRTAIIATVEPFFTAILGVLVLKDQLRMATVAGGVLIILAVVLIEWSSSTKRDALAAS